jgi:DNA-binding response OmpR family regulator
MGQILCVDDDRKLLQLKRRILERAGHSVHLSASVEEAIGKLTSTTFDAIITDWRLGENNARRIIEQAKLTDGTRVIVVSGFTAEAFQSSGPQADLYLSKPVDLAELLLILATLLQLPKTLVAAN